MSRKRKSGQFWNPPSISHNEHADTQHPADVLSATECTGLLRAVPESESEAKAVSSIYGIHTLRPRKGS